jgi:hypothetical protein
MDLGKRVSHTGGVVLKQTVSTAASLEKAQNIIIAVLSNLENHTCCGVTLNAVAVARRVAAITIFMVISSLFISKWWLCTAQPKYINTQKIARKRCQDRQNRRPFDARVMASPSTESYILTTKQCVALVRNATGLLITEMVNAPTKVPSFRYLVWHQRI